jgi:hopanoid biosynthesis associated RND transporter like protein HpnN
MRLFHRLLLVGVLSVIGRPRLTLIIAGVVLALCAGLAARKLDISTDQNKLFDPNVKFFQDFLRFNQQFPENEAIYVVIEARDPGRQPPVQRWTDFADALTQRLKQMPQYVKSVDAKVPVEELGSQGLLFDSPESVKKNFEDIKRFIPLVKLWAEKRGVLTRLLGSSPIERFITGLRTQPADAETKEFVELLAKSWVETIESSNQPVEKFVPDLSKVGADDPSRLGYYYVPDESNPSQYLLLVRVYQRTDYTSLTAISETVEAIRSAVNDVAKSFGEFRAGITGRPALEADEMRTTDRDSNRAEVIALIAVFIGLVIFLRSFWLALAGEIALGVGIGWTFGWATISVGELNLLSIVFLLALIGIGMDYLVQILTRYRQEVARREHANTIWISVFRHVAPPINTACVGAAGAFFVSVFTHFRGAAQLGIIAGGGLLLCLLSGYVVLPALLTIFPMKVKRGDELPDLGRPARTGLYNMSLPALWISLLLAGIPLMLRTHFDPSLLNMQAANLESVQLVRKLQTWSAVVLSKDLQTLRQARQAVQTSPLVARTESIHIAYDNLAWLREHESELPAIQWAEPEPVQPNDVSRLAGKARALAEHFSSDALTVFANRLGEGDAALIASRLSDWQRHFIEQLKKALAPFHPSDLDIQKLPQEMRGHYVGTDGSFALYIYPKHDLWLQQNLRAFVKDIEQRIEPVQGDYTLTGIALNIYHSTASIERSFHRATIYALVLIFILVLLDLRNLTQTLFAISVLAFGLPMLMAVMGWFGVEWNFANFFGLPILIGAGHEYGVFLVHRYREARHDPRRVWRRWDVSDRALLLCAYVTCTSFGFFWVLAHHRGLNSLGLVMSLGTACIYLAAVLVLRPLLIWRLARRKK